MKKIVVVLLAWGCMVQARLSENIESDLFQIKKDLVVHKQDSLQDQKVLNRLMDHTYDNFLEFFYDAVYLEKKKVRLGDYTASQLYTVAVVRFLQTYIPDTINLLQSSLQRLEYYAQQHKAGRLQAWYQKLLLWFSSSQKKHALYQLHAQQVQKDLARLLGQCVVLKQAVTSTVSLQELEKIFSEIEVTVKTSSKQEHDEEFIGLQMLTDLDQHITQRTHEAQLVLQELGAVFTKPTKIIRSSAATAAALGLAVLYYHKKEQVHASIANTGVASKRFFQNHVIEPCSDVYKIAFGEGDRSWQEMRERDLEAFYESARRDYPAEDLNTLSCAEIAAQDLQYITGANITWRMTTHFARYVRSALRYVMYIKQDAFVRIGDIDKRLRLMIACLALVPAGVATYFTTKGVWSLYAARGKRKLAVIREKLRSMLHVLMQEHKKHVYEVAGWLHLYADQIAAHNSALPWNIRQQLETDLHVILDSSVDPQKRISLLQAIFSMYPELGKV